ncbi:MAG: hypothetical protein R3B84_14525 [Zavarzinella sp.]
MLRLFFTCSVLLIGTSALVAQGSADTPVTNPYYPLKEGSVWKYQVAGGPVEVKVAGKETVKGVSCLKLVTSMGGKDAATELVAVTAEGVMRYSVNGVTPDQPILFLKAGAKKGDTWQVKSTAQKQEIEGTFTVDEEKVKIGDKEYETLHVTGKDMKIGSSKTTVDYWFAKDVGIVKLRFTLGTQEAVLELIEYKAGK